MNKLFITLCCVVLTLSLPVYSHSQLPQPEIKLNVLSPVTEVEIQLSNLYKTKTCYSILHNNMLTPLHYCLQPNETVKFRVTVLNIADKISENEICSITDMLNNNVRTRLCTKIKTYWPRSYL